MATIKTIAEKAKVSTATVSYVINNVDQVSPETRQKVLNVIREMNYKPNRIAKSLRMSKTQTLGVAVEDITVFNTPEIINGIYKYACSRNYHLVLNNLNLFEKIQHRFGEIDQWLDEINIEIDVLASSQIDGLIYVGMHPRNVEGIIQQLDKPIVYVYCYTDNPNDVTVTYDDRTASYEASWHLIENNHEKIAIISGIIDSISSHDRLSGYQNALLEKKLPFRPDFIRIGDWGYESGYDCCKSLLELSDPPTAIFAMNDLMALGAMDYASEKGLRVPQDLSVIGFDDREVCKYVKPGLTTIRLPLREMGMAAAGCLINMLNESVETVSSSVLPCDLIIRGSTGTKI